MSKTHKRYAWILAVLLAPAIATGQSNFASVDMELAVLGSSAGTVAASKVTVAFEEERLKLDVMRSELKDLQDRYEKQNATRSDEAKAALVREYGEKQKAFKDAEEIAVRKVDELRNSMLDPIIRVARHELEKLRAEGRYGRIIEWEGPPPYSGKLPNDITSELIKRIDAAMNAELNR